MGIKFLLESLGLKIDPEEITTAWNEAKLALPRLAVAFDEINATQKRIESKLDALIAEKDVRIPVSFGQHVDNPDRFVA